ncbi:glucan 1,3-beta-glucosidase [Xylariales sp. PMI_506]|nr:glucan 1,3-beta-glucosidase [Xylariales sp. PMI_506]
MGFAKLFAAGLWALASINLVNAVPATKGVQRRADTTSSYWVANIERQGDAVFATSGYTVFRNVMDYGAVGDGVTDDTAAINKAVQDGRSCIDNCDSSTSTPAIVYFPAGTYLVSTPIIQTYYTQFIGDATDLPTLKASSSFVGMAVIDSDPYDDSGVNWYVNQNNFFRQVRNFIIDITALPSTEGACIHWQVAQATSLQNIVFNMNTDTSSANAQKGIFMDNGSGGFMADLVFNGGGYGAFFGNQQFTTRNMTFNGCNTAIYLNWCWVWTMQGVTINNAQIGIDMSSGGVGNIQAGSLLLLDSKISSTEVGINTLYQTDLTMTNNTLILDNVDMSDGVTTAIRYAADNSTLLEGGSVISGFTQGRTYTSSAGTGRAVQAAQSAVSKPAALLSDGNVFTRTKPQYEDVAASSFVSVKSSGAKGDGTTDDTAALQKVFDSATTDQIVYFDHGAYLITDTLKVPKDIKITGEMWPLLMADGASFNDSSNPRPVFQIGEAGDVGAVELSDLILETKGAAPGAILMEWNVAGSEAGAAGMWDVHFRVGGSAGTELQSDTCTKNPNATHGPNDACIGTFLMFHATSTASLYVENSWFWTADHELDLSDHNQIDIYNGRGVLIESQDATWWWGTASEHSQLYNYQLTNAQNVWMSAIQTETAYMQGNPDATVPFTVNAAYSDPDFSASCDGTSTTCARTWGLRVTNSSDVFVYGAGLYSFFDNYDQDCLLTESCQDNIISIESSSVNFFGISTKASVNMITLDGVSVALDADNRDTYCATIAQFESDEGPAASNGTTSGGSSSGSSSAGSSGTVTYATLTLHSTRTVAVTTSVYTGTSILTSATASAVASGVVSGSTDTGAGTGSDAGSEGSSGADGAATLSTPTATGTADVTWVTVTVTATATVTCSAS